MCGYCLYESIPSAQLPFQILSYARMPVHVLTYAESRQLKKIKYSETCLKWPLKKDKTKALKTNGSLVKVESIAECSLSAILMTCIQL